MTSLWASKPRTAVVTLVALTLLLRLIPAWLLKAEVSDLSTYHAQAAAILRGDNIYAYPVFFPYLPFSQFVPAWMLQLAQATGWRFDFAIKLPAIVADAATTALIFRYLQLKSASLTSTVLWSLAWALNPVVILISAFHGNLMSVAPALIGGALLAAEAAEAHADRYVLLAISALLLGFSVAFRSFPIVLLPAFLVLICRTWREILTFVILTALPGALSALPYLVFARDSFLHEALSYSGTSDFGWIAAVRDVPMLLKGVKILQFDSNTLELSKRMFLLGDVLAALVLPFFRRGSLAAALLIPPLLFYGLYGGVAAQYLVWALAIAILLRERLAAVYTLIAGTAMVTFYTMYHPGILTGRYGGRLPENTLLIGLNLVSNYGLVLLSLTWVAHIVVSELRTYHSGAWSLPTPWVNRTRWLWGSRAYAAGLGLAIVPWLAQWQSAGARAQQVLAGLVR